ncbi:MAG: zinc ABC transporter substrate-binding protein [Planctomycetota bacterium]
MNGGLDGFLASTKVQDKPLALELGGWLGAMQPLKGTRVVTYHKDFTYFARRFGLEVVAFVEPKPGISPSAKHLVELVEQIKREQIQLLITRPWAESRPAELLADKTGIKVLIQPLEAIVQEAGQVGADGYFDLIDTTVKQIVASVGAAHENTPPVSDK